jgi:hypothetical protein
MFDQSPGRKREGKEIIRFRDELDNLMNRFFDWDCSPSKYRFKEGR